ncbi:MAG: hypothetical protein NT169_11615 [Chloroflexi bacterium]|nr:hypothetical protein [Chloroflexota bacterium]
MSRRLIVALVVALALVGVLTAGVLADSTTKQIGLVLAFPDGSKHLEIVTVPVTATTFDVLSTAKVNLTSQFTAFGPAVCSINNVGCPATNCFCDAAHYWAYYHLNAAGNGWTSAAEGVGGFVPVNGAVEGLAWSGFDANYNPTVQPPVYTFAQIVAATTPAPVSVPEPATLALVGPGLAALAGYVGKKNAKRKA